MHLPAVFRRPLSSGMRMCGLLTVKSVACVKHYENRLATALNDNERRALASFAADVGCSVLRKTVLAVRGITKRLPRQMLHHTDSYKAQKRRNAEIAVFFFHFLRYNALTR